MSFSMDKYIKEKKQRERPAGRTGPYKEEQDRETTGRSGSFSLDAYMEEKAGTKKSSAPGSFQDSIRPTEAVRPMRISTSGPMRTSTPTQRGTSGTGKTAVPAPKPEMDEKEALRWESRQRTQLAKGVTPERLAEKEQAKAEREKIKTADELDQDIKKAMHYLNMDMPDERAQGYAGELQDKYGEEDLWKIAQDLTAQKKDLGELKRTEPFHTAVKDEFAGMNSQELGTLHDEAKAQRDEAGRALAAITIAQEEDPEGTDQEEVTSLRREFEAAQSRADRISARLVNQTGAENLGRAMEDPSSYQSAQDLETELWKLNTYLNMDVPDETAQGYARELKEKYGTEDLWGLFPKLTAQKKEAVSRLSEAGVDYDKASYFEDQLKRNEEYRARTEEQQKFADKHPVISSVGSVLASPLQGVEYFDSLLSNLGHNNPDDPDSYRPLDVTQMYATNFVRNVRGTVAKGIEENPAFKGVEIGGQNIYSFLYQTGMSMGDFLFNSFLTGNFSGGLGGTGSAAAQKAAQNLSLAIMGSGAAANTTVEAIERGLSNRQAYTLGAIAGAAEIFTERFSLEALLDGSWEKNAVQYVLKNAFTEGSEEVGSDLINLLADVLVAKDQSEWRQSVAKYERQGMSESEAFTAAMKDQAISMGMSFLGGALSGGLMAGSSVTVNQAVSRYAAEGRVTNSMAEDILADQEAMKELGVTVTEDMTLAQKRAAVKEAVKKAVLEERGDGTPHTGESQGMEERPAEVVGPHAEENGDLGPVQETEQRRTKAVAPYAEEEGDLEQSRAMDRDPEMIRKQTALLERTVGSFGPSGQKAMMEAWREGGDPATYYAGFANYYDAGVSGIPLEKVNSQYAGTLTEDQKFAAYVSGQNDAEAALKEQKDRADFASVNGEEAGLVYDDYVRENMDAKNFRRLNAVLKALKTRAYFDTMGEGEQGGIKPGASDIVLSRDMKDPLAFVLGHEVTHRIQDLAPENYRSYREAVVAELGEEELSVHTEEMFLRYQQKGLERTYDQILDEVTADYTGELLQGGEVLDRFIESHKTPEKRSALEWLRDTVRGLIRKLTGKETREEARQLTRTEEKLTAALKAAETQATELDRKAGGKKTAAPEGGGGMRYAINKDFSRDIREWEKAGKPKGERFILGSTGPVLQGLGAIESDIYMNGDKISTILEEHPEMSIGEIERIPELLEYPALILKSKGSDKNGDNSRLVIFGTLKAKDGRTIMCVLDLRATEDGFLLDDMQKVNSAYTKDSNPKGYISSSEVLYANEKRALRALRSAGFTDPVSLTLTRSGSVGSITYRGKKVNISGVPFSEVVKITDDKRFSLESGDGLREMIRLRKDNEALKKQVDYWRGQTRYTKELTPREADVKKAAAELIQKYSSTLKPGEITKAVGEIWKGLQDERNSYESVKTMAQPLAKKLVESALEEKDGPGKDYRDAAEHLKKTKILVPQKIWNELESKGGYGQFRKENFGRLKLSSKEGTPIDVAYKELAQRWPGLFDEAAYSTQGDQLLHMAETAQALEPVWKNPYQDILEAATDEAATDIVSAIMDGEIQRMPETMADRMGRKIRESRQDHWEGRKKDAARLTEIYRKIRKRDAQDIAKRFAEMDTKKTARRERTETKARIYKVAEELTRRVLKPTDAKHVQQDFRRPLAALLATIDLGSGYDLSYGRNAKYERVARDSVLDGEKTRKTTRFEEIQVELAKLGGGLDRTQALAELQNMLGKNENDMTVDPDLVGTDGWIQQLIKMGDKPVDTMTGEELRVVNRAMVSIAKAVSDANNLLTGSRWQTVKEAAEEIRRENRGKKARVTRAGILGKGQELEMGMLTPEAFFHRLGEAGDEMFRGLRKAQDKQITILAEVAEKAQKVLKGYDVRKAEETIHDVNGVKVSTAQIINLYNLSHRKQAMDHIGKGGVKPEGAKEKGKMLTFAEPVRDATLGWIANAISKLTDEDIRVAKGLQQIMATTLADYGNEASMEVFGYKKFEDPDYWTIKVNGNEVHSEIGQERKVMTPANYGMTKQTQPDAKNSVKLGSAFDVFAEHATEMSTYAAFLGTMEDMKRIYNYQFGEENESGTWESSGENVKSIVEHIMGKDGQAYWEGLMTQLAVGVKGQKVGRNYTGALMGNWKASAIGANVRVWLQQPTAILRAADMINPVYLTRGAAHFREGWNKALKYAPIAKWKDWGYYDISAGRQIKDVMFETDHGAQKVTNLLMAPAGWMDSVAWGQLWNAVELETRAEHKELKVESEEYYSHVAERFAAIIDHSQVVDGILQRSQMMRDPDGLAKMATAFMSEPIKQANMVMTAVYDIQNAGDQAARTAAWRKLGRTAAAMGICIVVNGAVKSIVDAARRAKDDREKKYWERWIDAMFGDWEDGAKEGLQGNLWEDLNPISYIPYVKDVLSLVQGYDVKRADMEVVADLVDGTKAMMKALQGGGKRTVSDTVTTFAAALASLVGLPAGNLKRAFVSTLNSFAADTDNYVLQYAAEKMIYRPKENKSQCMNILWRAFRNDRNQYEIILTEMREDGIEEDYIKSDMVGKAAKELDGLRKSDPKEYERLYQEFIRAGISRDKLRDRLENMQKKEEGVDKVSELSSRYLMPDQQEIYDAAIRQIQESHLWGNATGEQRDKTEADLFYIASGSKTGEEILKSAEKQGMEETEYLLYQLALSMVDEPNKNGNLGTYTKEEKAKALRMMEGN